MHKLDVFQRAGRFLASKMKKGWCTRSLCSPEVASSFFESSEGSTAEWWRAPWRSRRGRERSALAVSRGCPARTVGWRASWDRWALRRWLGCGCLLTAVYACTRVCSWRGRTADSQPWDLRLARSSLSHSLHLYLIGRRLGWTHRWKHCALYILDWEKSTFIQILVVADGS